MLQPLPSWNFQHWRRCAVAVPPSRSNQLQALDFFRSCSEHFRAGWLAASH